MAQGDVQRRVIGRMRFGAGVQDRGGEEAKVGRGPGNVHATGEAQRLTRVDRLRPGQLLQPAPDQLRDAQQDRRALGRGRVRPPGESPLRRCHRARDVGFVAVRELSVHLAGRRLQIVEISPARGLDQLAADVVQDAIHS